MHLDRVRRTSDLVIPDSIGDSLPRILDSDHMTIILSIQRTTHHTRLERRTENCQLQIYQNQMSKSYEIALCQSKRKDLPPPDPLIDLDSCHTITNCFDDTNTFVP